MDQELTVAVQQVTRRFGAITALSELDLAIPKGAITVLLGPNGAGKTTAIRMITGALAPNSGTSRVFGLDPAGVDGEEVRRRCGVVSAKPSLYDRLNGWDNLRYAAELYGVGRGKKADSVIYEAADTFGIDEARDQHQLLGDDHAEDMQQRERDEVTVTRINERKKEKKKGGTRDDPLNETVRPRLIPRRTRGSRSRASIAR